MTSEFFKYHWFWNRTKIATYRRPRGAYDSELDTGAKRCFQGSASRESPQNLELLFNIDEHKLRPNGRTSLGRKLEIDITLFARVI